DRRARKKQRRKSPKGTPQTKARELQQAARDSGSPGDPCSRSLWTPGKPRADMSFRFKAATSAGGAKGLARHASRRLSLLAPHPGDAPPPSAAATAAMAASTTRAGAKSSVVALGGGGGPSRTPSTAGSAGRRAAAAPSGPTAFSPMSSSSSSAPLTTRAGAGST
ncbi:unnamed protein product, partial [Scytosiphon promiscuus]